MRSGMAERSALDAIARIENALSRIEAAARQDQAAELARLRDTHDALRARVETAVQQLDRLLADEEDA